MNKIKAIIDLNEKIVKDLLAKKDVRIAELEDELEFVIEANRIGRSNVMKIRGLQSQIAAKNEAMEEARRTLLNYAKFSDVIIAGIDTSNLIKQIDAALTADGGEQETITLKKYYRLQGKLLNQIAAKDSFISELIDSGSIVQHISTAVCSCDPDVGFVCEPCLAKDVIAKAKNALTADGLEIKEVAILPHLLVVEGSRKKLVNEKELAAMRAVCKAVGEWIKHFDTWPDSDNSGGVIRPEDHGHKITMWWADQEELEINIETKYAALAATREVFSPLSYIEEELAARGWSWDYLAKKSGLSVALLKGNVDDEVAGGLSRAFSTSKELWLGLGGA